MDTLVGAEQGRPQEVDPLELFHKIHVLDVKIPQGIKFRQTVRVGLDEADELLSGHTGRLTGRVISGRSRSRRV